MIQKAVIFLCCLLAAASDSYAQAPKQLKEVVIKGKADIRAKGDTLEYDAAHYKTKENAVVEELLRKLPGVRIDRAGNIIAQGETVLKVLVDGKEFFGNDPAIATRNLPANMVDKIQVLDKKSDQAAFTGIDDGKSTKTINIVTKKEMKKGHFGNVSAGAGNRERYEAGMNVNSFAGDKQLSFLFKANNVNKSGFSAAELLRLAGNNPEIFDQLPPYAMAEILKMKGVQATSDGPEELAQLSNPTGLNNTQYGGVNFNNDFANNTALRSSYFYNRFASRNNYSSHRLYQLPDTSYHYYQQGNDADVSNNHRVNASIDIPVNARNSIKISPIFNSIHSIHTDQRSFRSMNETQTQLLNDGTQYRHSNTNSWQATADILLRHKFRQERHTLSLTVTPAWLNNNGLTQNTSFNNIYNIKIPQTDSIHQQLHIQGRGFSVTNQLVYTIPLSRIYTLQLSEDFNYSSTQQLQSALNFDPVLQQYAQPDERYHDNFSGTNVRSAPGIALSAKYKRFSYTAATSLQTNRQQSDSRVYHYRVSNIYHTLLPNIYARYQFSPARKISFNYQTNVLLPGLSQLQSLPDISDPVYIRQGNPYLKPAIRRSVQASYLFTNASSGSYTNITANGSMVSRQFTDYAVTDSSGKQRISTINANGYANTNISFQHFFKTDEEGSGITYGILASYNAYPSLFNGIQSNNKQYSIAPDISFNYYPASFLNISAHINTAWNHSSLLQKPYWLFNYDLSAIATLPWNMQAESEWTGYTTSGLSNNYNSTALLWNVSLNKNIGKKYAVKIAATDLLRQNKNIMRMVRGGYTEDQQNTILGQYFMASLIYQIRSFKKSNSSH